MACVLDTLYRFLLVLHQCKTNKVLKVPLGHVSPLSQKWYFKYNHKPLKLELRDVKQDVSREVVRLAISKTK